MKQSVTVGAQLLWSGRYGCNNGRYCCTIVMSYIEINKAVSQWLLTFNLCVSVTWPLTCAFHIPCTHTPEIIDMHRGMCDKCSEWPPTGRRHSWRGNTGSPWSQCCIWYNWPPLLTSHTGIVIWHPRKCFGLVPILFNWPHSNSSYQEMYIWAPWAEVWCATGIRSGSHTIHHLHHTTGKTHQEAWSDFSSLCRWYAALSSI